MPPSGHAAARLALRLETAGLQQAGLVVQDVGNLGAEIVDEILETVVEHVSNHGHAAAHPLAAAAEFRMAELGHAALSVEDGDEHVGGCVGTDTVARGKIADYLLTGGCEVLHGENPDEGRR